ncbi:uncharacterized protein LOC112568983 [Pomacea canaliculata]|uniref:uncharacterized protein LOC112568983 n=1 Tax=Pomacea canaliculata TaxID=400727 RepID=UPI000D7323B8|nr:uncharacterized protein LOC112568983 [Pomacea canaliculata]
MATEKSAVFAFLLLVCAGCSYGQSTHCSTNQVEILSQVVTCITKDHPEYFLTVLTRMNNPQAMESPDFLCDNPGLVVAVAQCFLQYIEGCMPQNVASQFSSVMPTSKTIQRGITFLCDYRKDFADPCLEVNKTLSLIKCYSDKIQASTLATSIAAGGIQDTLCMLLGVEEKCISDNLQTCSNDLRSKLKAGLLSFFPYENCSPKYGLLPQEIKTVLRYKSEHAGYRPH